MDAFPTSSWHSLARVSSSASNAHICCLITPMSARPLDSSRVCLAAKIDWAVGDATQLTGRRVRASSEASSPIRASNYQRRVGPKVRYHIAPPGGPQAARLQLLRRPFQTHPDLQGLRKEYQAYVSGLWQGPSRQRGLLNLR